MASNVEKTSGDKCEADSTTRQGPLEFTYDVSLPHYICYAFDPTLSVETCEGLDDYLRFLIESGRSISLIEGVAAFLAIRGIKSLHFHNTGGTDSDKTIEISYEHEQSRLHTHNVQCPRADSEPDNSSDDVIVID